MEILSSSLTCFDASQYGALVICDPELEYDQEEIDKLYRDVATEGMGLIVLADWYVIPTPYSLSLSLLFEVKWKDQEQRERGGQMMKKLLANEKLLT